MRAVNPPGRCIRVRWRCSAREGISTEGYHSKSWDNLPLTPDVVITVCSNAAGETCPAYLGRVVRSHWGVEDPAHATGTDAEIDAAFMTAYRILRARIEAFLALPLSELKGDPAAPESGAGPNWHACYRLLKESQYEQRQRHC